MMSHLSFFSGFFLGLSLIVAIGAQNAFVLKQGLIKRHVGWVCFVCAFSDAFLIALGVLGFGALVKSHPEIEMLSRYFGALFLVGYGIHSFQKAWRGKSSLAASGDSSGSLFEVLLVCLAFTWLNPHVYLDTVVLLGAISTQYAPNQLSFGMGACVASFTFFFALGYGARLLSPLFAKPQSWRILDMGIGLVMILIAIKLLL